MENRDNQTPQTGSQSDLSKSQSQQQPTAQDGGTSTGQAGSIPQNETDGSEMGQSGQSNNAGQAGGSFDSQQPVETGQADYGSAEQSDTLTGQRSDVEGASLDKKPEAAESDGFIGSQGSADSSSELVENDKGIPSDGE